MSSLGSIRRSGIEIEGDGEIFCIENDECEKVLTIDTKKKIFKTKDISSKCILLTLISVCGSVVYFILSILLIKISRLCWK